MIPENTLTEETKNEFDKIKEIKKTVDRENLVYRTSEYTCSFKNFWIINIFGGDIYKITVNLKVADKEQSSSLNQIMNFKSETKRQNPEKNKRYHTRITNNSCKSKSR